MASVLSARTIPEDDGETEFVSTRLAWDRLSDEQRDELRDLVALHLMLGRSRAWTMQAAGRSSRG
jgi:alpha-ketoglutarate-dependent taurine dioxygenase